MPPTPKRRPFRGQNRDAHCENDLPKTGKRSGTARANGPKTGSKRSRLVAENGASESGKKKLWHSFGTAQTHATVPEGRPGASLGIAKNGAPRTIPQKQGNAAARRAQTAQKQARNGAVSWPKTGRPNPVRKSFGKALARPIPKPQCQKASPRQASALPKRSPQNDPPKTGMQAVANVSRNALACRWPIMQAVATV